MKKKDQNQTPKKLQVKRDTLRNLSRQELVAVQGGDPPVGTEPTVKTVIPVG